jgi:hypothetical protein
MANTFYPAKIIYIKIYTVYREGKTLNRKPHIPFARKSEDAEIFGLYSIGHSHSMGRIHSGATREF